jgi:alkylated DNA nucleotide flippase Atl1
MNVGDGVAVRVSEYPHVPDGIYDRLAWLLARVPSGRVVTYATLLQLVGAARPYSRVLPTYLRRAAGVGLPAHRVLTSSSSLTGHFGDQAALLTAEGVAVDPDGVLVDSARLWDARGVYFVRS